MRFKVGRVGQRLALLSGSNAGARSRRAGGSVINQDDAGVDPGLVLSRRRLRHGDPHSSRSA